MAQPPREETQGLKRWLSGQGLTAQMAELCLKPRTCHNHLHPFNWEETESQAKPASVSLVRNVSAEGRSDKQGQEGRVRSSSADWDLSVWGEGVGRLRMWLGLSGVSLALVKHWV